MTIDADNRLHINAGTQYIDDFNGFMANISALSATVPYMMTVGNHEVSAVPPQCCTPSIVET